MRVAFILSTNSLRGGGSAVFRQVIHGLVEHGVDPLVIAKRGADDSGNDLGRALEDEGIRVVYETFKTWCKRPEVIGSKPWLGLAVGGANALCDMRLRDLFSREGVDAVVVFDGVIGVGYAPARWLRIPSIGYLQESVSEGLEEVFYSERVVRRRLRTTARCIAISQYVKRCWSSYCDPDRIVVVPNGLDETHVWHGERPYAPDGLLRVTIAGSIISHKGQLCLVRALDLLEKEEVERIGVRMYGARDESERGAYEREVRDYVRGHGLDGVVTFHPYTHDIASVWRDTDIVVVASRAEGFGLVTAEAMASGCVVVGTDSGATAELLGEGRGILFSFDDPQDLARALREAVVRVSQAHAGKVTPAMRFARGFTAEAQTQAVLQVIREACESSAGEGKAV